MDIDACPESNDGASGVTGDGESARSRAAKIEDVAAVAGVSVATVSRAVRGLPNVAPATRRRVLDVAAALNYRPDPHASRLAAGQTRTVAVAVPMVAQWYFAQVVSGIEAVLADAGYDLLLYSVSTSEDRARFVRDMGPLHKRADGLITIDRSIPDDEARALAQDRARVVMVGTTSSWFPSMSVDNVAGARLAVEHLLERGHRRIGLIGGLPDDPLRFEVPDARRAGYAAALSSAGIVADPALDVSGTFSIRGGYDAVIGLLDSGDPPTAVFAMSDEMAIGVLKAAADRQIAVPGELAVIGFDDHEMAEVMNLTTVRQPVVGTGEQAATTVLEAIDSPSPDGQRPSHTVIPVELVVRGTTG